MEIGDFTNDKPAERTTEMDLTDTLDIGFIRH